MNIVVIWDQLGQEPLRFFVTQNPRFLAMDRLYINTYTDDALLDAFPCEAVRQGAPVVVCGFLP
jgi:hypothetical protein